MDFDFKSLDKALLKLKEEDIVNNKTIIGAVCNAEYYDYLLRIFEKNTSKETVMYYNDILGILLYKDVKQIEPWMPFYDRKELDKYLNRKEY